MTPIAEIPCCGNCPYLTSPQLGYLGCENNSRKEIRIITNAEINAHADMGCLSHPHAGEYLNRDAIAELNKKMASGLTGIPTRLAIKLLKGEKP